MVHNTHYDTRKIQKILRYQKNNNILLDNRVSIVKKKTEIPRINVGVSLQYLHFDVAAIRSEERYVWQSKFSRSN